MHKKETVPPCGKHSLFIHLNGSGSQIFPSALRIFSGVIGQDLTRAPTAS